MAQMHRCTTCQDQAEEPGRRRPRMPHAGMMYAGMMYAWRMSQGSPLHWWCDGALRPPVNAPGNLTAASRCRRSLTRSATSCSPEGSMGLLLLGTSGSAGRAACMACMWVQVPQPLLMLQLESEATRLLCWTFCSQLPARPQSHTAHRRCCRWCQEDCRAAGLLKQAKPRLQPVRQGLVQSLRTLHAATAQCARTVRFVALTAPKRPDNRLLARLQPHLLHHVQ